MHRPRVISELSSHLAILLRSGLRSGGESEAGIFHLASPEELEGEGPAPAFFLHLFEVSPDRRAARSGASFETAEPSREGLRGEARRPPLWVACRYLAGARGRDRGEEEELLGALFRTLHDHPCLSSEHLPSLRGVAPAERFPLEILDLPEGWRWAGLTRPRPLVAFQATVPIPSAISDPLDRILDREILLEEMP